MDKERIRHFTFLGLLLFLGGYVTFTYGFARGGFADTATLQQYFLYGSVMAISALGILLFYLASVYKTDDAKYGNSVLFSSPGETPAFLNFKFLKRPFILVFISLIFSSLFWGILPYLSQQTALGNFGTDVAVLQQQTTKTDNLIFSSFLVPISENLGVFFLIAIFIYFFRNYAKNSNMSIVSYKILVAFFVTFLLALSGILLHELRYSDSDRDIFNVGIFWGVGGIITSALGSFTPFWIMHLANNLFFFLATYYSSTTALTTAIGLTIVSIFFIFLLSIGAKKNAK